MRYGNRIETFIELISKSRKDLSWKRFYKLQFPNKRLNVREVLVANIAELRKK